MKRDDPGLAESGSHATQAAVERRAAWFDGGLFGWYHVCPWDEAPGSPARDCVAVLCAPIGPEYTRSHRTLRHLADRLARAGVPCLRFDYDGTGDSAGDDEAPDRVAHWRESIARAARHARELSGARRLCLVGVRLGATLAALEAQAAGADLVVLWNPVVKGRAHARELQAMALTANTQEPEASVDAIESAGFRVSTETLAAIKALGLETAAFKDATRILLVERDDIAGDASLAEKLAREGIAHDRIAAAGWNAMMADHQFTVVPEAALDAIRDWVTANAGDDSPAPPALRPSQDNSLDLGDVEERLCAFGDGGHLFGVLARPKARSTHTTVVLLNAGSIHHVGPHRLYVRLARELARAGHRVLRLDFEGIGDSVLRGPGRENHPYSPTAMDDLAAALDGLRRDPDYTRFVVMGVCSGAYNSFQAGLVQEGHDIERLVLVNPWYFHWREGLSLDTTLSSHYEDVAAYGRSMRDAGRWKRLLRGEVDLARLARVAATHLAKLARGRWADLREIVRPGSASRLSQDLRAIAARGRRIHVILSDGEPAHALLMTEAARTVRQMLRSGAMTIDRIRGGDHTFSRLAPRSALVARIRELLEE